MALCLRSLFYSCEKVLQRHQQQDNCVPCAATLTLLLARAIMQY
jgi:hypothetical protein